MGFWGALAGVTVGVGAVALAPFTGGGSLVGIGLAASLAGAGAVAAGAGAVESMLSHSRRHGVR